MPQYIFIQSRIVEMDAMLDLMGNTAGYKAGYKAVKTKGQG